MIKKLYIASMYSEAKRTLEKMVSRELFDHFLVDLSDEQVKTLNSSKDCVVIEYLDGTQYAIPLSSIDAATLVLVDA